MVTRKPYHTLLTRLTSDTAWYVGALMSTLLLIATAGGPQQGPYASLNVTSGNAPAVSFPQAETAFIYDDKLLPDVLPKKDVALYQTIFAAQKKADWAAADAAIAQLSNKLLLGHVLAARYLNRHYTTPPSALDSWLTHYADHPEAQTIYALALAKTPSIRKDITPLPRQSTLEGYGDDNGSAARVDNTQYVHTWNAGLNAWRNGNRKEAAKLFSSMAKHQDTLSPSLAAAASYWAYRSYHALGNDTEGNFYLHLAAIEPRSFYGILARKQLKEPLDLDSKPVHLSDADILEMIGDPAVRRTLALAQVGELDLADQELRAHFPQADTSEKYRLLSLAHDLNLASVQISMAKQLSRNGQQLDFARYPVPGWQPEGGFTVEPALIFALMRQESGFRSTAISPGGALGLMQLMPQTALLMQKNMNHASGNASEPVLNMTLGQNYVQHLLNNDLVNGNLFYLLAAYNAGPGRLQEWKAHLGHNDDPLLFVESIPYPQTRYYVMQVMANYWIYSELAGVKNGTVHTLAMGNWPSYGQYIAPVADRGTPDPTG